jgi:dolichyl-phosphate beta-glucosyltransferase
VAPEQPDTRDWVESGTLLSVMPDLTVVVPAYDEADRIADSVRRLATYLASWPGGGEVIVVDDGSHDGTFREVEAHLGSLPVSVRLLRHPENKGKGAAVRTGVLHSRGRLVGFTDADLSYSPEVFESFGAAIDSGAHVVVGRRSHTGGQESALRRLAHLIFGAVVRRTLHIPVSDTQCGIKLFAGPAGRALFARCRADGFGFDPEVIHLAVRWRLRVVEREAALTTTSTTSTVRLARDIPGMLFELARARWRRVPRPPPELLALRQGSSRVEPS